MSSDAPRATSQAYNCDYSQDEAYYEANGRYKTGSWVTSIITGIAGFLGTQYHLNDKFIEFDSQVATKSLESMKDIAVSIGNLTTTTDGAITGSSIIQEKNALDIIKEGKNKLARVAHNIGGRSMISLLVGLAAAAIGAGIYSMVAKKPVPPEPQARPVPQPEHEAHKKTIFIPQEVVDVIVEAAEKEKAAAAAAAQATKAESLPQTAPKEVVWAERTTATPTVNSGYTIH